MFVLLISLIQAINLRRYSRNFGIQKKYFFPKKKHFSQHKFVPHVIYQEEENGKIGPVRDYGSGQSASWNMGYGTGYGYGSGQSRTWNMD